MAPRRTSKTAHGGHRTPYAVVLAAGQSSRFGDPKPLAPIKGKPLIGWVLDAIPRNWVKAIVVVLGRDADSIAESIGRRPGVRVVANDAYLDGMAGSIRAGLSAQATQADGVLVLLADQPLISRRILVRLLQTFDRARPGDIVAAIYRGTVAPPVIFPREYFPELTALKGDHGAKSVLQRHRASVVEVMVEGDVLLDVDTPADLAAASASLQS